MPVHLGYLWSTANGFVGPRPEHGDQDLKRLHIEGSKFLPALAKKLVQAPAGNRYQIALGIITVAVANEPDEAERCRPRRLMSEQVVRPVPVESPQAKALYFPTPAPEEEFGFR